MRQQDGAIAIPVEDVSKALLVPFHADLRHGIVLRVIQQRGQQRVAFGVDRLFEHFEALTIHSKGHKTRIRWWVRIPFVDKLSLKHVLMSNLFEQHRDVRATHDTNSPGFNG